MQNVFPVIASVRADFTFHDGQYPNPKFEGQGGNVALFDYSSARDAAVWLDGGHSSTFRFEVSLFLRERGADSNEIDAFVTDGGGSFGLANVSQQLVEASVAKIVAWTSDIRSAEVRRASQDALYALFSLHPSEVTRILSNLPKVCQVVLSLCSLSPFDLHSSVFRLLFCCRIAHHRWFNSSLTEQATRQVSTMHRWPAARAARRWSRLFLRRRSRPRRPVCRCSPATCHLTRRKKCKKLLNWTPKKFIGNRLLRVVQCI